MNGIRARCDPFVRRDSAVVVLLFCPARAVSNSAAVSLQTRTSVVPPVRGAVVCPPACVPHTQHQRAHPEERRRRQTWRVVESHRWRLVGAAVSHLIRREIGGGGRRLFVLFVVSTWVNQCK